MAASEMPSTTNSRQCEGVHCSGALTARSWPKARYQRAHCARLPEGKAALPVRRNPGGGCHCTEAGYRPRRPRPFKLTAGLALPSESDRRVREAGGERTVRTVAAVRTDKMPPLLAAVADLWANHLAGAKSGAVSNGAQYLTARAVAAPPSITVVIEFTAGQNLRGPVAPIFSA